jgi:hypothetical protein
MSWFIYEFLFLYGVLFAVGLFLGMLTLIEVGRHLGARRITRDPEGLHAGTIEASVLALLGLLLAFTISGAGSRLDARRLLIIEETNAIGTAYLRLDMLPEAARSALQENFRRYLDTRIEVYRKLPDIAAAKQELGKANDLQQEIWQQAVAAVRAQDAPPQAAILLLPALNTMIDITMSRTLAMHIHPPPIIFILLCLLALISALLTGYGMAVGKMRSWLYRLCFAFVISVSIYVIIDMEFPRAGFIRVDAFDQAMTDLRETMR